MSVMAKLAQAALSEPHALHPTVLSQGHFTTTPQINRERLRAVLKDALDLIEDTDADFPRLY